MTKVLHLARNPKVISTPGSDSGKTDALLSKIVELETRVKCLEEELDGAVKSRDRLKSVYHSVTQGFKQAYTGITGWCIDAIERDLFRVRSVWIDDEEEYYVFEVKHGKVRFRRSLSRSGKGILQSWVEELISCGGGKSYGRVLSSVTVALSALNSKQ